MSKAISTTTTAVPATTPGLPAASRRQLLAGSGLGAALALIGLPAAAATGRLIHPDADLIRLCAQHTANWHAYNQHGGLGHEGDPDPLWDAYERTRDAISAAKPRTMDGLRAVARTSLVEADGNLDGFTGTPAEFWVVGLVKALASGAVA